MACALVGIRFQKIEELKRTPNIMINKYSNEQINFQLVAGTPCLTQLANYISR